MPSLVEIEIGLTVLEKKIFKFRLPWMYFRYFVISENTFMADEI